MIEGESLESRDAGLSVGLPLHGVCIVDHHKVISYYKSVIYSLFICYKDSP